ILLVLFLGNLRAALAVALVLPLAALATFVLMRSFGMSANLMSLGGLAIAIGMLVDAAVVVVENIETRLARGDNAGRLPLLHVIRSEEHTSELQSRENLVCRLLLEKKKKRTNSN